MLCPVHRYRPILAELASTGNSMFQELHVGEAYNVFERFVHSTKCCLRKVLGQAKFTHDELLTALAETEMVINSRPLTYVSADVLDELLISPLTPACRQMSHELSRSTPDH